jgi:hypothetical protein
MPIATGGINVTVKAKPAISVEMTDKRTAATTNTQPVTIKAVARTVNQLADILDVVEASPEDGNTLVYNAATDKYEVKKLTVADITVDNLDGGTF